VKTSGHSQIITSSDRPEEERAVSGHDIYRGWADIRLHVFCHMHTWRRILNGKPWSGERQKHDFPVGDTVEVLNEPGQRVFLTPAGYRHADGLDLWYNRE